MEISVTHDRGEVPCSRRRGERKLKGMVGEGWILDRVYIYNKSDWNRNNLSSAHRYSCLYYRHQPRRESTLASSFICICRKRVLIGFKTVMTSGFL